MDRLQPYHSLYLYGQTTTLPVLVFVWTDYSPLSPCVCTDRLQAYHSLCLYRLQPYHSLYLYGQTTTLPLLVFVWTDYSPLSPYVCTDRLQAYHSLYLYNSLCPCVHTDRQTEPCGVDEAITGNISMLGGLLFGQFEGGPCGQLLVLLHHSVQGLALLWGRNIPCQDFVRSDVTLVKSASKGRRRW